MTTVQVLPSIVMIHLWLWALYYLPKQNIILITVDEENVNLKLYNIISLVI